MTTAIAPAASGYAPAPLRRGYQPPAGIRPRLKELHRSNTLRTIATALADHALIAGSIAATAVTATLSIPAAVAAALAAVLISARSLRGLENLLHEASHFNWANGSKARNDRPALLLAAVPAGSPITGYRESHYRHHQRFGTENDPDRRRYLELDLDHLDRSSTTAFLRGALRRFPAYQAGWIASTGAHLPALGGLLLYVGALLGLGYALAGAVGAASAGVVLAAVYLVALPLIRFTAEASEHVYPGAESVFDATVSNLGPFQRLVLHPHGDGYHTVHHMWPSIPHFNTARAHRLLMEADPDGYGARLRVRHRVLDNPVPHTGTAKENL
ncbi:fatty acid desaturase [Salininema proteolyticum]|uniref:Fatty acid desaturase n=1 Tax=Salininema proteolyticum TaxID=1607685 RepID=A0ABV8TWA5_9ACTN